MKKFMILAASLLLFSVTSAYADNESYEVMFTNSIKIEFAGNGEWKEVKCKYSTLPEGIVPQPIVDYVGTNFPGVSIYAIDRGYRDVEVSLTNGLELTFDSNYTLVDIDD